MTSLLAESRKTGWGYLSIDPLRTLASDRSPHHASCISLIFILFFLFLALAPVFTRLCTPRTPRAWATGSRCRRGSALTLQLLSIMAPMLKKKVSESDDGSLPFGCDDNRSALPAACQLLGLVPSRLN